VIHERCVQVDPKQDHTGREQHGKFNHVGSFRRE
jgi:hypothetical protein